MESNFLRFAGIAIQYGMLTFASLLIAGNSFAQAPMTDVWLKRSANHIFTGVAVHKEERYEQYQGAGRIVGELKVALKEKKLNLDLKEGDTVVVGYWRIAPDKAIDPLKQQPVGSLTGHWGIPNISDDVRVFAKGSQSAWFDVLFPYGFQRNKLLPLA